MIKVSDLRLYLSCPRQIYFMSRGHELKINRVEYVEHLLLRGLAFQFPILVKEGRLCDLGAWLNKIADELKGSLPKEKIDLEWKKIHFRNKWLRNLEQYGVT